MSADELWQALMRLLRFQSRCSNLYWLCWRTGSMTHWNPTSGVMVAI